MTHDTITISPGSRFRAAMVLAMMADALQIVVFPLFIQGALSGTGIFCHRFLPSSYPESIWFLSGRWRLQTCIGNRSGLRSPQKKVVSSTRC